MESALITPRTDFQAVLKQENVIIFGGYGSDEICTSLIEIFNTRTKQVSKAEYRLPLGVCSAKLAWHGRDLILIGGERLGRPSGSVIKLDFDEKSILSLRDLGSKRVAPIALEVAHD